MSDKTVGGKRPIGFTPGGKKANRIGILFISSLSAYLMDSLEMFFYIILSNGDV